MSTSETPHTHGLASLLNPVSDQENSLVWLARRREGAGSAAVRVDRERAGVRVCFDVPGATADSAQVAWDAEDRRLLCAVWRGPAPKNGRVLPSAELMWLGSVELDGFDGTRARAHVHRGAVSVWLPYVE